MRLDPLWSQIFSDLFVNLSAGWWATVVILPATTKPPKKLSAVALTGNILSAMLSLILAFIFKKLGET